MIRKTLAAILAAVLLSLGLGASPAQAGSVYGCPDLDGGSVCFYNWINFHQGGGFWQRTKIWFPSGGCINLNNHYWTTGGFVYDQPSSMIINGKTVSPNAYYKFYTWANCNENSDSFQIAANGFYSIPNMSTMPEWTGWTGDNANFYDDVASMKLMG